MLTGCRFKGAYCSVWETEPLTDIFGEMDVLVRWPRFSLHLLIITLTPSASLIACLKWLTRSSPHRSDHVSAIKPMASHYICAMWRSKEAFVQGYCGRYEKSCDDMT